MPKEPVLEDSRACSRVIRGVYRLQLAVRKSRNFARRLRGRWIRLVPLVIGQVEHSDYLHRSDHLIAAASRHARRKATAIGLAIRKLLEARADLLRVYARSGQGALAAPLAYALTPWADRAALYSPFSTAVVQAHALDANESFKLRPPASNQLFQWWMHRGNMIWRNLHMLRSVSVGCDESEATTRRIGWWEAMQKAEAHCARNPFPGVRPLARIVGCSGSTMSKAINKSDRLRAMLVEHENRRRSVSARTASQATWASVKQTRESDPLEAASTDELFSRLRQQAKPSERAKLDAMTPAQQRELVAVWRDDPDKC